MPQAASKVRTYGIMWSIDQYARCFLVKDVCTLGLRMLLLSLDYYLQCLVHNLFTSTTESQ